MSTGLGVLFLGEMRAVLFRVRSPSALDGPRFGDCVRLESVCRLPSFSSYHGAEVDVMSAALFAAECEELSKVLKRVKRPHVAKWTACSGRPISSVSESSQGDVGDG